MPAPKIFFQPEGFNIGDAMPYEEDGTYYFYHYKTPVGGESAGWTLTSTRDFLHYEDHGVCINFGKEGEKDAVFRSAAIYKTNTGLYHMLYGADNNGEKLYRAVGREIGKLVKDGSFEILPPEGYSKAEFRDASVFWDDSIKRHVLVMGARKLDGKRLLNGCVVWYASSDAENWEFKGDIWASKGYTTLEMPDLFRIGEWWYLIVSEYSSATQVIYRASKSMAGPWLCPARDCLDGAAYFAGRTANGALGRYMFGWVAGKSAGNDRGAYDGSSGLWVHEICRPRGGELCVAMPRTIYQAFARKRPLIERPVEIEPADGREEAVLGHEGSKTFLLELEILPRGGDGWFSINLLGDETTGQSYEYKFHKGQQRLELGDTPNHGINPADHFRGMERLSRPILIESWKPFKITVLYDDTYVVLYVNGAALSGRLYGRFGNAVSVACANCGVTVNSVRLGCWVAACEAAAIRRRSGQREKGGRPVDGRPPF